MEIKTILAECGFGFKKQLGQNFITDKNLLASIVTAAGVGENDEVVEIGCGAGTLTRALAERVKKVTAFEVDKTLQPVLERTLAGLDNTEVVFRDFLKVDLKEFEEKSGEYFVVANLPYYVTTPLIMKLIEDAEKCKGLSVMVQEEVAERLCAKAGTPEYGAITAMVALRAECAIVKRVPRTLFYPRPNVDSAVVKFTFGSGVDVKDKSRIQKSGARGFLFAQKDACQQPYEFLWTAPRKGGGNTDRLRHRPQSPRRNADAKAIRHFIRKIVNLFLF